MRWLEAWLHRLCLLPLLAASGCEPHHGAETFLSLKSPPNIACIDAALRQTPGVGQVAYAVDKSDEQELTPEHKVIHARNDYWTYTGDQAAILQTIQDGTTFTIQNGDIAPYKRPKSEVDAGVVLMRRVNGNIEARCGIPIASKGRFSRYS